MALVRKVAEAIVTGVERLLRDPGMNAPAIRTGQVIIEQMTPLNRVAMLQRALESKLAPEHYVNHGPDVAVPAGRVRQVAPWIVEEWEAVPAALDDAGMYEAAMTGVVPTAGWRVRQRVTLKQTWVDMNPAERAEVLQSINGQVDEDAIYNGYYPTIKGNDVAHHDPTQQGMRAFQGGAVIKGNPSADGIHDGTIRGGTEIRGGRREYRERTKNYVTYGPGYWEHVERIRAELQAKRDKFHRIAMEKADASLPRQLGEL